MPQAKENIFGNMDIGHGLLGSHSNNPAYASSKLCEFIQVMTTTVFTFPTLLYSHKI